MDERTVRSSLLTWLASGFSATSHKLFDDEPDDREAMPEYVEFLVLVDDDEIARKSAPAVLTACVEARVVVKAGNRYRAEELAAAVESLLEHAEVPIVDYDSSGETVGWARFREPTTDDFTRLIRENTGVDGRWLCVVCEARVEAAT